MDPQQAAVQAVLHVIACKLNECAVDGDDELTMRCIELVAGGGYTGKDIADTPKEFQAITFARKYAGQLGQVLEQGMHPSS